MDKTPETIERLSREVVDSWDMDTLVSFAIEQQIIFYSDPDNDYAFREDYKNHLA